MEDKKTKICKHCGIEKPLSEFYYSKGYYYTYCRICTREIDKIRRKTKPELYRKYRKTQKERYPNRSHDYYVKDKKENPEKYKSKRKKSHEKHKEKESAYYKMWYKNNRERRNENYREYCARHKDEPKYRLMNVFRNSIRRSLKNNGGNKNNRHWELLAEYTVNELKQHLEKQFTGGMTWGNYGQWHIDHIIPVSAFNFSSPEHIDFKRCWALKNLRPLWAKDNRAKSNKLEKDFQPSLAF